MKKILRKWVPGNETRIREIENLYGRSASNGQFILERSGHFALEDGSVDPFGSKWGRVSSHMTLETAIEHQDKLKNKIAKAK